MTMRKNPRSRSNPFRVCLHSCFSRHPRQNPSGVRTAFAALGASLFLLVASFLLARPVPTRAQTHPPAASEEQKSIAQRLGALRQVPDAERARVTKQLALDIRRLLEPVSRVNLASGLANLATEGDFGRDTLQEVAATLADALRAHPVTGTAQQPAAPYVTLAQLARYENARVSLDAPPYAAALSQLEAEDRRRQTLDFTLTDLQGKAVSLKSLTR